MMNKSSPRSPDPERTLKDILHRVWTLAFFLVTPVLCYAALSSSSFVGGLSLRGNQILAFGLLAIVAVSYLVFRHLVPLLKGNGNGKPELLSLTVAGALQKRIGEMPLLGELDVQFLTLAIVAPCEIRKRLIEEYDPCSRVLIHRVAIDGEIPPQIKRRDQATPQSVRVPFPFVIAQKGKLFDNFKLTNQHGRIAALSYAQSLELAARVLRVLILTACKRTSYDQMTKAEREIEQHALLAIIQRTGDPIPGNRDGVAELKKLKCDEDGQKSRLMAETFVQKLSGHYAITAYVDCDSEGRFSVYHERTVAPALYVSGGYGGSRSKGWLRVFLGARPVDLSVPIANAYTCESYHLHVNGEDGLYLASHQSIGMKRYLEGRKRALSAYSQSKAPLGQPYGHFYSRFFPTPRSDDVVPVMKFTFHETPPGSAFRAAIAATSSLALIWLVAWSSINFSPRADAPAFLLVFPAVAAAWLGFDSPSRRLLEGTLAARVSLIATAVGSILASGLYMIYQSESSSVADSSAQGSISGQIPKIEPEIVRILKDSPPWDLAIPGVTHFGWSLLIFLALMNMLYISYTCIVRTWVYVRLCQSWRSSEEDPDFNGGTTVVSTKG